MCGLHVQKSKHADTHTVSFVIDQFLSAVLCSIFSASLSSFLSRLLVLLVSNVGGERLAAVVDRGAREVHFDGENVRLLQDSVALVVVVGHARNETLQLENNVLNCRQRGRERQKIVVALFCVVFLLHNCIFSASLLGFFEHFCQALEVH